MTLQMRDRENLKKGIGQGEEFGSIKQEADVGKVLFY